MKAHNSTHTGRNPFNIILAGNSNITRGAYEALCKRYGTEIANGYIKIIIVTKYTLHHFYGFLNECITGILTEQDIVMPLADYYPHAEIICGTITENHPDKGLVKVELADGVVQNIRYIHMVAGTEHFVNGHPCKGNMPCIHLNTLAAATELHGRLKELVDRAARSSDRFQAARILRITVGGNGAAGMEIAASIAACQKKYCREYGLANVKPTVYLLLSNTEVYETVACSNKLEIYTRDRFYQSGIRLITGKKILRTNADGAVIDDGSFISCSLVVNTDEPFFGNTVAVSEIDAFGKRRHHNNWSIPAQYNDAVPEPSGYLATIRQGGIIGYNIAASIENTKMKKLRTYCDYRAAGFGSNDGFFLSGKFALTGLQAAIGRYFLLLKAMPSQQRRNCAAKLLRAVRQNFAASTRRSQKQVVQKFLNGHPVARFS